MSEHDFQFFENVMIFFSKMKVIKYFFLIFIFHICAKFQTIKKRIVYLNVFNHTVTFWKNYMNFAYDECHNHFWRK
jgi:hypothetical protein